jgi:hypothetical protein
MLLSDFVQVANVRTYTRKTKIGAVPKETYMEKAKIKSWLRLRM